jgi:hypothetical protein
VLSGPGPRDAAILAAGGDDDMDDALAEHAVRTSLDDLP